MISISLSGYNAGQTRGIPIALRASVLSERDEDRVPQRPQSNKLGPFCFGDGRSAHSLTQHHNATA